MKNPPSRNEIQNLIDKYMNIEKKSHVFKPIIESNLSITELAYYKASYVNSNQKDKAEVANKKEGNSSYNTPNDKIQENSASKFSRGNMINSTQNPLYISIGEIQKEM